MKLVVGLILVLPFFSGTSVSAATWKASGQIGLVEVFAQLEDNQTPMAVLIRAENHSRLAKVEISRYFVQMTDAENRPLRPITADDLVSERLEKLRQLLPRQALDIDAIIGDIRADYPQEKIVEVYGRLQKYLDQGLPITWRSSLENWLLAKPASTAKDEEEAGKLIKDIGDLGRNYLWPRDLAPDSTYTGVVFFEQTSRHPASIFFEINHQFIGMRMTPSQGNQTK